MRKLGKAQMMALNILERGGELDQVGGWNAMYPAYEMWAPRTNGYDHPTISWKSICALEERGLVEFSSHHYAHRYSSTFRITIRGKRYLRQLRKGVA